MHLTKHIISFTTIFLFSLGLMTISSTSFAKPKQKQKTQLSRKAQKPSKDIAVEKLIERGNLNHRPLLLLGTIALLTLLPFFVMLTTSFLKISVVLSIIRTALGTPQIPPNQVITGLAIILSLYTMMPVAMKIYQQADIAQQTTKNPITLDSTEAIETIYTALIKAQQPVKDFLAWHSHRAEKSMFFSMSQKFAGNQGSNIKPDDLIILIPAFAISELKEAFQIGFILFIPFLVIDLIVANILMALGMQMLSPSTISLPFKLLLFVMIDGWHLITRGLIQGYIV